MSVVKSKEEVSSEFERISREMIKFLCDNCHPHTHVVITCNSSELSEGVVGISTDEYIKD